ncbi:MAG: PfkB family carbohydrate kinase [Phycisphaerales bacterium]
MPLIVTGTVGIDTVYTPAEHREKVLGGSCTYFAAAASFYGPVRIVAAVGDDFPPAFGESLARFGRIDTAGLEHRKGSKTFAWGGKYFESMNRRETLFTELGVLIERPPAVPAAYADSQFVFLANSHPAVQLGMLEPLTRRRLVVADTMDLWIKTARAELDLLLTKVDGLVLNYDEAELLTGKANTVTAARHILRMGPKFVVVKKGEHGCILVHKDGIAALPAYPTEQVVDPTGAGDSFAGGMMGHIAGQMTGKQDAVAFKTLREALAHGTVVASFTIENFSLDRLAKLTPAELDRRYQEFVGMVRV